MTAGGQRGTRRCWHWAHRGAQMGEPGGKEGMRRPPFVLSTAPPRSKGFWGRHVGPPRGMWGTRARPQPAGHPLTPLRPRSAGAASPRRLPSGSGLGLGSGPVTPVGAWRALVAAGGSRWPRWRPCESAGDSCAKPSRGRQGQAGCKAPAAATASPPLGGPCLTLHPWGGSRCQGGLL